jgi:cytochrome c biogenesis protein CcmG/thiol:disulfide interchange protein DsbE
MRLWLPLAIFLLVAAVVAAGLWHPADRTVRSRLVSAPLPPVVLSAMVPGKPAPPVHTTGAPRLINVFGSWCVPCAAEAPQLARLRNAGLAIDGVAVRDTSSAVEEFLARYGDPYRSIGDDHDSAMQLALGSSGVPESYLVGVDGRIQLEHVGALTAPDVEMIARRAGLHL